MSAKCQACGKSIYPMDPQINLDGIKFHKECAKCADCKCQITISNFTKNESKDQTVLLCKTHYFKRFHEGGSYLGGENFKVKSDRDSLKMQEAALKANHGGPSSADAPTSVSTSAKTADSEPAVVAAEAVSSEPVQAESNEPVQAESNEPVQAESNEPAQAESNEPTQAESSEPVESSS